MKKLPVFVVIAAFICLAVFPFAVHAEEETLAAKRVVLLEVQLDTYCSYCYAMMDIYNQLRTNYGHDELAIVLNHIASADPLWNSDSEARQTYYSNVYVPLNIVDGVQSGYKQDYTTLEGKIVPRLSVPSLFEISASGSLSGGSLDVHIDSVSPTSATDLKVRYVICEDSIWVGPQLPENPIGRYYNFTCRKMLPEDPLTMPLPSGGITFPKSFTPEGTWKAADLSLVVFIQSDADKKIQQAYSITSAMIPEVSPLAILPFTGIMAAITVVCVYPVMKRKRE